MGLVRSIGPGTYAISACGARTRAVRETRPPDPPKPRLLDRVREALRTRHYSPRTEEAYVAWIRRYIFFHGKRHPAELGGPEVTRFLTALAVEGRVAASTQNQALSALLFLYRDVLGRAAVARRCRARKRPERLPVVLTRDEVRALIERLPGTPWLMACLLYGRACASSSVVASASRTSTSGATRSSSASGKGDKDRTRCCRRPSTPTWSGTSPRPRQHQATWPSGRAGWSCRPRSPESIRMPAGNGGGSGSSPPRAPTSTAPAASGGGTTCTRPSFSARSSTRCRGPGSPSRPARTRYATRSRPTSWRTTTTSAPSKSSSATATCRPPRSTPTFSTAARPPSEAPPTGCSPRDPRGLKFYGRRDTQTAPRSLFSGENRSPRWVKYGGDGGGVARVTEFATGKRCPRLQRLSPYATGYTGLSTSSSAAGWR